MVWQTENIIYSQRPSIALLDNNEKYYATVYTAQIKAIDSINSKISYTSGTHLDFLIVEGKEPNAFAFSNQGRRALGINIGMLDLLEKDYDAFAFLIGHESAHHVKEHGKTRQNRDMVLQTTSCLVGTTLGALGIPGGGILTDIGTQIIHTAYTRDEEREADSLGLDYMMSAGFDPQGAIRLQRKLKEASSSYHIPLLNTHPSSEERIRNLSALIMEKKKFEADRVDLNDEKQKK